MEIPGLSNNTTENLKQKKIISLSDRKMTKDCTQPLRIGNIRALNGCAGRLFGAATLHNHKNSANKSNRKAMNRNWCKPNQISSRSIEGENSTETETKTSKHREPNQLSEIIIIIIIISVLEPVFLYGGLGFLTSLPRRRPLHSERF